MMYDHKSLNHKPQKTTYDRMAVGSLYSFWEGHGHPTFRKISEGYSQALSDPEGKLAGSDYRHGIDDPSKIVVYYYGSDILHPKA